MAESSTHSIPISAIEGRYLIFDVNAIAYLRKHHQICGVFVGTLPQNPSQNVFMGLPMEIMPEEAQILIDHSIGYILDDAWAHDMALAPGNRQRQSSYVKQNETCAAGIAEEKGREKDFEKQKALRKLKIKQGADSMGSSTETVKTTIETYRQEAPATDSTGLADTLYASVELHQIGQTAPQSALTITPTSSNALVQFDPSTRPVRRISGLNTPSYVLYRHLHSKAYYQTPGLRFGCQFCVYPGDPLRFHSHFLAVGHHWDEELDLMDIVGGGRLGTGVKKGWLIGGKEANRQGEEGKVRTWSVEWAGM